MATTKKKVQTPLEKQAEQALSLLRELGNGRVEEEEAFTPQTFAGFYDLGLEDQIKFLESQLDYAIERRMDEQREMQFARVYNYRPWDGALATYESFKKAFGTVSHKGSGSGIFATPPQMIDVPISPTEKVQVPWGTFVIPALPGATFHAGGTFNQYGQVYQLTATAPRKWRKEVEGLFSMVEDWLVRNSIYKGKAFDGEDMPNFLDPYSVNRDQIVYSASTRSQIEANILAPIMYPETLAEVGITGKRAVLLTGPFGTGKTSTAMLIAQIAEQHGWTFVYAKPQHDLNEVFQTARLYEPSVVFFEDLDKLTDDADRDRITSLLDLFDGVASKDAKIMSILTTNYPENIYAGMIRPGRLDAIVHLDAPDAAGIRQLIEQAIPEHMRDENIDWDAVAEANRGENKEGDVTTYLPAFIREGADRAVRYGLVRTEGNLANVVLTTEDLVNAAEGLRPQWLMMSEAPDKRVLPALDQALGTVVRGAMDDLADARGWS